MILEFVIPIVPRPLQRPRFSVFRDRKSGRNIVNTRTPQRSKNDETAIGEFALLHVQTPITGLLAMSLLFVMKRPASHTTVARSWPDRECSQINPDLDNMTKLVLDGLNGILYRDDSQVVDLRARKIYAAADERPHTHVSATTDLDEETARVDPDQGRLL